MIEDQSQIEGKRTERAIASGPAFARLPQHCLCQW